jgi:hypothetical protein
MKKMQNGKFTLSEFIKSLITLQTSVIHHIEDNGLQDVSNVLPELQTVNAEFRECEIMFSAIETKLQEKLGQVQKSYEELCKGTVHRFSSHLSYTYFLCVNSLSWWNNEVCSQKKLLFMLRRKDDVGSGKLE